MIDMLNSKRVILLRSNGKGAQQKNKPPELEPPRAC